MPDAAPADVHELRLLAAAVARDAGRLLHDGLDRARLQVDTKSTHTDMVTEMDRAAEALIVDRLLGARPADGMLGEEGTDRPGTSGVRWIVDPLDGTTNYLYGLPGFNVSIAAEVADEIVAAAVFDVVREELFSATLGGGATRDGAPIRTSDATELSRSLIATGFSYDATRRRKQARVLVEVLPQVRDIRRFGAAAVDLCSVACGRMDGYYEKGLATWDVAAGALIAREAGAIVTAIDGGPLRDDVIAGAPGIAIELRTLVHGAGAADA